jgi:hypothetical protein
MHVRELFRVTNKSSWSHLSSAAAQPAKGEWPCLASHRYRLPQPNKMILIVRSMMKASINTEKFFR